MLKFEVLAAHGLNLGKELILNVMRNPDNVFDGYRGRRVAQGPLDEERVLRVIYEEKAHEILIITFYPGRRERYEKSKI